MNWVGCVAWFVLIAYLWGDGYGPIDFPSSRLAWDERSGPRQALTIEWVLKSSGGRAEVQGEDPNQCPQTRPSLPWGLRRLREAWPDPSWNGAKA